MSLAAAAAVLDRVGLGKGSAAPAPSSAAPSGEALHARLRRMTGRELDAEVARIEADAACGQVVVYLPAEDETVG